LNEPSFVYTDIKEGPSSTPKDVLKNRLWPGTKVSVPTPTLLGDGWLTILQESVRKGDLSLNENVDPEGGMCYGPTSQSLIDIKIGVSRV